LHPNLFSFYDLQIILKALKDKEFDIRYEEETGWGGITRSCSCCHEQRGHRNNCIYEKAIDIVKKELTNGGVLF
jgi:hypothetical protein